MQTLYGKIIVYISFLNAFEIRSTRLLLDKGMHINGVIFRSTTSTDLFNDRHKE